MTEPTDLRASYAIRHLPALAGLRWIQLGFRAFRKQPGGFMGLFGMFLLAMLVFSLPLALLMPIATSLQMSPVVVDLLGVVLMPLLTLAFMLGTESVTNDLRIRPVLFFAPLRGAGGTRMALLEVGLVYVCVLGLAYIAGNGLDGGEASTWFGARMMVPTDPSAPAMPAPPPALSEMGALVFCLKVAVVALGSIPLWHAPALIHWGRWSAAKAMFGSVVALWRTRAAFAVFLLGWCAVGFVFSSVLAALDLLLDGSTLLLVLAMIASWALSAVFYVTLWFGFVDTFELLPGPQPT